MVPHRGGGDWRIGGALRRGVVPDRLCRAWPTPGCWYFPRRCDVKLVMREAAKAMSRVSPRAGGPGFRPAWHWHRSDAVGFAFEPGGGWACLC